MRRYLISDPEIFRVAGLLIERHGEEAPLRAAVRANDLLEGGDMIGSSAWRRILGAIEELRRGIREGEAVN